MNYRTFTSRLPKHRDLVCFAADDATKTAELKQAMLSGPTGYIRQERADGPVLIPAHMSDAMKTHLAARGHTATA